MDASKIKDKDALVSDDPHLEMVVRIDNAYTTEKHSRDLAVEDLNFANAESGQWDDEVETNRGTSPRFTFNRVAAAIGAAVGEQRQSDINIKVRPLKGGATKELAEIYEGLIRNIEDQSNARCIYDTAFDEMLGGGYGGFRVITKFMDDDSFDQEILIKPVNSATTSLFFDPGAQEFDKSDAMWAAVTTDIAEDEFKARYPKASVTDFSAQDMPYGVERCNWFKEGTVRIVEYFRKVPVTKSIGLMSDGSVIDMEESKAVIDELALQGRTVVRTREVKTFEIEQYIANGVEVLEGPTKWAGSMIPLVDVAGKVTHIDGKVMRRGAVRFAKDPQRTYNYARSAIIEASALAPKDPIWMTGKQAEGYEQDLQNMNVDQKPVMFYNPDPEAPGAPQRTGAPQVQQALIEQAQQAEVDIQATMGIAPGVGDARLGSQIDRRSGEAVIAQGERQDVGSFIYFDNLTKAIETLGKILVDLIPKIYDTERVIRVMGEDSNVDEVTINETVIDRQTREAVMVNDLSQGRYDLKVTTGPAFSSRRAQALDRLMALAEMPVFADITPDLIADKLDIPGGDELKERMRKQMISQGVIEPTEEEAEELGIDQMNAAREQGRQEGFQQAAQDAQLQLVLAQADQLTASAQKARADAEKSLAGVDNTDMDTNKKSIDGYKSYIEALEKQAGIGIPVGLQEHDNRVSQNDLIEESQQSLVPGPNSELQDVAQQISNAAQEQQAQRVAQEQAQFINDQIDQ